VDAIERRVAWQAISLAVTFGLALLVIVGFSVHGAIDAHRHPTSFP
jgi:hypothetical protein